MANLERTDVGGVTVLKLKGSLNQTELADVEKSFHEATHRDGAAIVIDLSNVDFLTTPATSAAIFRSATDRLFIQHPQSGCTYLIRSGPRILAACSIRPATKSGDSITLVLMSITPRPMLISGRSSLK